MKNNKFSFVSIRNLIVFFIVFSLIFQATNLSLAELEGENHPNHELNLTSTDGIVIGDANITLYTSGGSGNAGDPYIIEDLHVNTTDKYALYFDSVTHYFEVRDSTLFGDDYGMYIKNPGAHFEVINSTFVGGTYGVYISSGFVLDIAYFDDCYIEGSLSIGGSNVHGLNIHHCTMVHNQGTTYNSRLNFTNNIVHTSGSSLIGIRDYNSTVKNNIFYGNNSYFRNMRAVNSTIEDNVFYNSSFYIYDDDLADMLSNTYSNNIINGKPFGFLYDISDTTIPDEYGQIYLLNSDNVEISNADFVNVYMGIQAFNCSNLLIESVTVIGYKGIVLEFVNNLTIKDSTFYCYRTGIYISNVENLIVQNNYYEGYSYGFEIYNFVNYKFNNNTIYYSAETGVYFENGVEGEMKYNIIITDIEDEGSQMSIYLWDIYNTSIYYNVFIGLGNETAYLAYEGSCDNVTWYNPASEIGNFWSNWNKSGAYQIEGDGNLDLYPIIDFDEDTLNETMEVLVYHTNPFSNDSDSDGLSDSDEIFGYGSDPTDEDTDSDGLLDGDEAFEHLTDPTNNDTDSDGLNDGEEINTYNTSPLSTDSDDDGLTDGEEVLVYLTSPTNNDTDSDGLIDGDEVLVYLTSPTNNDTDSDGFSDFEEIEAGTDPLDNTSFPIIPSENSYLGLILGLSGGFLGVAGLTVYFLIRKGIIKLPKKITK
ncbi:MAG: right-handed parallel beta-helix repeat-containing protein [Candidatus Heimdallarchaeaceae archaeon]